LDPIHGRGSTDEQQLVPVEIKQNAVTDDVSVITARHHLLGFVRHEVGEAVDRQAIQHSECIGSFDRDLGHVV
jgi:hypothetical protein